MKSLLTKLIPLVILVLFSHSAMATLFKSNATLTVNMTNSSKYVIDQIIFDGGAGNENPTANFTAGLEVGENNTSSLKFRAAVGGDQHYNDKLSFYAVFKDGTRSLYCTVNFNTTPTYYVFVANRVYPSAGDVSGPCTLEVNGNSEITITVNVP